jgi:hypothetical protein
MTQSERKGYVLEVYGFDMIIDHGGDRGAVKITRGTIVIGFDSMAAGDWPATVVFFVKRFAEIGNGRKGGGRMHNGIHRDGLWRNLQLSLE